MDLYETYLTHYRAALLGQSAEVPPGSDIRIHYAATLGTAHGVQREPFLRMESIEVCVRAACKVEEARSGDSR